jgi:hypothetical protein
MQTAGNVPAGDVARGVRQGGDCPGDDFKADAALERDLGGVAEQPEAGDIGAGMDTGHGADGLR